ncbi:PA14 domain-containing protein [Cellvibrio japonicus]|uniref:Putative serine protease n=1 Tax=Cellvibrio japonicus (strain Ueda107) TaxID=498211 RepID=B3PDV4_CELJU|nr:serine protease [Cellvibrio japonicus]ACE83139.1 putative serine protease [Cellvibrio japonicus Ueda107]
MNKLMDKNWIFSGLILAIVVLILIRITPESVDPVVKLVISKNRASISNIYQPRDVEFTKEVMVDRLNLLDKSRFSHPKLGNIAGYSDDFFVDVQHRIQVLKGGQFRFMIGSDDGFSLSINGKKICEHLGDRPYSVQPCFVQLEPGTHDFNLSYFQGFGNSGLTVQYALGSDKPRWFGDNSSSIKF